MPKTKSKLKQYKVRWEESRCVIVQAKNAQEAEDIVKRGDFAGDWSDETTAEPQAFEVK